MIASSPGAAFFDLDHVLIAGSSLFLLARDLRSHDVYDFGDLVRLAAQQLRIKVAIESDHDRESLQQSTLSSIAGREQVQVQAWGRQLAALEVLPRVYPDMVRIIAAHRMAGDRTYLVTSAPHELAWPVAHELEMDGAMGSTAEVDERGRYTGRSHAPILGGASRRQIILEWAEREGTELSRCHVYANSVRDKELLKSVGFPHAVNADAALLRTAVRRGWAVHELRPLRRKLLVGRPPLIRLSTVAGLGYAVGRLRSRRR